MTNAAAIRRAVLAGALLWHVLSVFTGGWVQASKEKHARDFASYYYAARVAMDGGDPYDVDQLEGAARGVRARVFPFFYPPPFLLGMAWIGRDVALTTAYRVWFWLDELCLLAAALALWRWWRPLGPSVAPLIAASIALLTAIPNNHLMGQANLPVLALALAGLALVDPLGSTASRRAEVLGGALLGAACMAKMSPALLVAWWLLRRRWWAVGAACATAVLLSLATLPLVDAGTQLRFYTDVLPGFSTGSYNGLTVDISLFGNHSIPNVWDGAFPNKGSGLSTPARWLTRFTLLGVAGGLLYAFRRPTRDPLALAAQAAAIGVGMLLVPVYTYEHHVVWAIPAVVVSLYALGVGRLSGRWAIPVGLAVTAWAFELAALKRWALTFLEGPWIVVMGAIQEQKFIALLILLGATVWVGARSASGYAPGPEGTDG